jgi:hypothetical protein
MAYPSSARYTLSYTVMMQLQLERGVHGTIESRATGFCLNARQSRGWQ